MWNPLDLLKDKLDDPNFLKDIREKGIEVKVNIPFTTIKDLLSSLMPKSSKSPSGPATNQNNNEPT